jgi:MFS family permease
MNSTLAPVASLLAGVGFLIAGHGLQITLIPLSAAAHGWTAFEIGAVGSAYYVGFVAGCFGAPFVILRAGHIRAFAAAVSLAAAATVSQPLWIDFAPWLVFRAIIGASLAGLYMIIESWLNDRATNETRGLVMSAYIVVNFTGITIGQLSVTLYPPTDFPLFAIATIAIALAAIPVVLTRSAQPAPITLVRFRPAALYRSSPVGVVGVTLVGVTNGAFWALGTISGLSAGLTAAGAAVFMSVATAGGAVMQWPVGRFSDRVDRRIVLIALLCVAALSGLVLAFVPLSRTGLFVFALFFGMATLPTYSIAAAHAYDHAEPGTYVETAAGILLLNALGAIAGPLVASTLIEETNASYLFLFIAIVQVGLAAFAFTRLGKRPAMATAEKTDFDLAATAAVGMVLPPEPLDLADPNVVTPPPNPARATEETTDATG